MDEQFDSEWFDIDEFFEVEGTEPEPPQPSEKIWEREHVMQTRDGGYAPYIADEDLRSKFCKGKQPSYQALRALLWYESKNTYPICNNFYAAFRDGYWAVVDERGRQYTPFAFTWIDAFPNQHKYDRDHFAFLVERFGKKGVYLHGDGSFARMHGCNVMHPHYPVPCAYESIELTYNVKDGYMLSAPKYDSEYIFVVRRAGLVGKANGEGTWIERLHPEQAAK